MKKNLLLVAFAFIIFGMKAQVVQKSSSEVLTEASIAQILDNSRKNGVQEWEITSQNKSLHETMLQQQAGNQSSLNKGNTPPPQINTNGCVNPGFENGTVNGWTFAAGSNNGNNLPCPSCLSTSNAAIYQVVNSTSSATVNPTGSNCLVSNVVPCTNGIDNYGNFPVVPPGGGNYSLLLNNTCAGYKMQQAQYSFVVGASNDLFTFQYAAVLQDGSHPITESPYFDVTTTDLTTGALVTCAQYTASATSGNLSGWSTSSVGTGVYYKPWTTVSLDLQSAIGHTVSVQFTVSDCNQSGHFGYCYIDADCSNPTSAAGVVGICGTTNNTLSLTAPPGYTTYQWYGPSPNNNTPIAGATSQTLTTQAVINDTFTVKTTAANGCPSTFKIVINPSAINVTTSSSSTCKGGLNGSASVSTGGTGTFQYVWTGPFGPIGTNTTTTLNNLPPGTYSVSIIDNIAHCTTKDTTITVIAIPPVLQTSTNQLCGTQTILNAPNSYVGTPYSWYDNTNTITSTSTQTYNVTNGANAQHYTVTYLDSASHCLDSLKITLNQININFTPHASNPCAGGNNGSLYYSASPGNSFSNYDWTVTGAVTNGGTNATAPIVIGTNNLPVGTYSVIITAPGNSTCFYTDIETLTNSGVPLVSIDSNHFVCNMDTLKLQGATLGVTHSWSGTTAGTTITYPYTTSLLTVYPAFTNTTVGYYSYTDSVRTVPDGCLSISKYKIGIKHFNASVITPIEKLKCFGDSIGKLKASVTSEVNGPINSPDTYTYDWVSTANISSPNPTHANGVPSSSFISGLKAGTYTCIISNGNCVTTKTYTLLDGIILPLDSLYAYYCPKDSLALLVADTGNTGYKWHPDNGIKIYSTKDSIQVLTQNINNYYVTYKHNGCPDTAKVVISVTTYNAFRPNELVNIFSPNGDGRNDVFYPFYQANLNQYQIYKQSQDYELKVYNRWGKLVYETTDYNKPWDGKTKSGSDADAGSYFFVVKYQSNCGSKADVVENKGFVELLR